jgi:hypothetical protein
MGSFVSRRWVKSLHIPAQFIALFLLAVLSACMVSAQDIPIGVTYVCSGEHIYIENCNIRDTSDTSTCMVAHPDHLNANGMNTYTYLTRGALKKLLPTCTQPSQKQMAAAQAFQKKQQDLYEANAKKAEDQLNAPPPQPAGQGFGAPAKPKTPEERAINRCITSGRLPASCTGNSLLGAFGSMLAQVLPGADKQPGPGPVMAGVFQGAGGWRLDFIDGGVLMNCASLSPTQEGYSLDLKGGHALLTLLIRPKPVVVTVHGSETITSAGGPVTYEGTVASGYHNGTAAGAMYQDSAGNQYDASKNKIAGPAQGYTTFTPRTVTCPAMNLSSKGAGTGIQTMQTDLLKSVFGGDKGPPTPPGIRMRGIFAAPTGFSVQFFPESVILGCGPDAARAYPYSVVVDGARTVVKVDAPDHPLALAFRSDGSLDPGTGAYQVHGRVITGENDNDDFTFAPMEQTCQLGVLTAANQIPSGGGAAAAPMMASGAAPGAGPGSPASAPAALSSAAAPLGNATLSIVSGFPPQPGVPNPLAGRPYVLLRSSYADALAKGGVSVPAGTSPYKYVGMSCANRAPDCQKSIDAIKANAISSVRSDGNGSGTFPGVPPGTYYLMISAPVNNKPYTWGQAVQLRPGANSITLDLRNGVPLN